jgi:hypothetical protein
MTTPPACVVCRLRRALYYCTAMTRPMYWLCLGCAERHRQWAPGHELRPAVEEAGRV